MTENVAVRTLRWLTRQVHEQASQLAVFFIEDQGTPALLPGQAYVRLWISHLFLADARSLGADVFPAVHASVRLCFGGHERATFSRVARLPDELLAHGDLRNYQLTELLPYRGGVVELEAALFALRGDSRLRLAMEVLTDVSKLVVPSLSTALAIGERVAGSLQRVLTAGGQRAHLAVHESFVGPGGGGNQLRRGYLAAVAAPAGVLPAADLVVANDRLCRRDAGPLTGYDYLLLRIEGRDTRDDGWDLPEIRELMTEARVALAKGRLQRFEDARTEVLTRLYATPDLTEPDRTRLALLVRDELDRARQDGLGAAPEEVLDLGELVERRAISTEEARARPRLTLTELLNGSPDGP